MKALIITDAASKHALIEALATTASEKQLQVVVLEQEPTLVRNLQIPISPVKIQPHVDLSLPDESMSPKDFYYSKHKKGKRRW